MSGLLSVPGFIAGVTNIEIPSPSFIWVPAGRGSTVVEKPAPTSSTSRNSANGYIAAGQAFSLSASGLRPSTVHYFSFNNADVSSQCRPSGGSLGDPLVTDSTGSVSFTFYYSSGIETGTNVTASQSLINSIAGNKTGVLSTPDGSSSANVTVKIITS